VPGATPSSRLPAGRPPLIRRSAATAIAARRTRSARVRRRRRQVFLWLLLAVVVAVVSFGSGLVAAPLDYNFQPVAPKSVLLQDASGHTFATIRSPQIEDPVAASKIPTVMRQAIVAAEDQRFYSNSGVDPLAMARAAWRDITGHSLQGGSTITQQYVKNVYTGSEQTALRKLREASLAIRLEQHLTKDQILTRYLNTLYLGNGTAGVEAASEFYFGVPIVHLDRTSAGGHSPSLALARAAVLAGMAPAPSVWNPVNDPTQARARELYVLNRMFVAGYITSEQAGHAYGDALPHIAAKTGPEAQTIAPEFRDLVAQELNHYGDTTLFASGGMRVKTTLDLDLQQAATQALGQVLPKQKGLDAAVVAVDPRNGDLRALAEHKAGGYVENGLDLAAPPPSDITRSSGSTIKPFTLAAALEHGHSLSEGHYAPQCVRITAHYRPCNAEGGAGYYTLQSALEQSVNTVYAPLAVQVGLNRVVKLARRSGMQIGHLDRGTTCAVRKRVICPSYALGIPVSPLSEADAFGTIVDHGMHHAVRSLLSVRTPSQGQLFKAAPSPAGERAMPAQVADQVTTAMQGVVDVGTGQAAHQPFPVYGKTGTTDNFYDAWFTGCTHTLCITVWMGYDHPHELKDATGSPVYGGTVPARLFAQTYTDYRAQLSPTGVVSPTPTYLPVAPSTPATHPSTSSTAKPAHGAAGRNATTDHPTSPSSNGPKKPSPTSTRRRGGP
jgi:penicillin-binding protein 1A